MTPTETKALTITRYLPVKLDQYRERALEWIDTWLANMQVAFAGKP